MSDEILGGKIVHGHVFSGVVSLCFELLKLYHATVANLPSRIVEIFNEAVIVIRDVDRDFEQHRQGVESIRAAVHQGSTEKEQVELGVFGSEHVVNVAHDRRRTAASILEIVGGIHERRECEYIWILLRVTHTVLDGKDAHTQKGLKIRRTNASYGDAIVKQLDKGRNAHEMILLLAQEDAERDFIGAQETPHDTVALGHDGIAGKRGEAITPSDRVEKGVDDLVAA